MNDKMGSVSCSGRLLFSLICLDLILRTTDIVNADTLIYCTTGFMAEVIVKHPAGVSAAGSNYIKGLLKKQRTEPGFH